MSAKWFSVEFGAHMRPSAHCHTSGGQGVWRGAR